MTTYWRLPNSRLQELRLGALVEVNGRQMRVVRLTIAPATEDDEDLGVEVGDMLTTVEFGDVTTSVTTPPTINETLLR